MALAKFDEMDISRFITQLDAEVEIIQERRSRRVEKMLVYQTPLSETELEEAHVDGIREEELAAEIWYLLSMVED